VGAGHDVEGLGDGGAVVGEVDAVELAYVSGCACASLDVSYPSSPYPVV
jgi:hypothetical protein